MSQVCVISYEDKLPKQQILNVADCSIVYSGALESRRKLRRFLNRYGIERAVVCGDAPDFVLPEMERTKVKIHTGEHLMQCVYPKLISRAAKIYRKCDNCTVYDTCADGKTLQIIACAASYFKNVALKTCVDAQSLADEVMYSMGLALKLGEGGGVGIIRSGSGGMQKIKVDLTHRTATVFADKNNVKISPSVAEAIAGDDIDENVLERLKLKIYSLC